MSNAAKKLVFLVTATLALESCEPEIERASGVPFDATTLALVQSLALDERHAAPPADELTALGHALFFDPALSGAGDQSCASCHEPLRYFSDGHKVAQGRGPGLRNTPSLLGAAKFPFLGWGGSTDSLWSQALGPLEDPAEMDGNRLALAHRIASRYRKSYETLFGPLPDLDNQERFPTDARPLPGPLITSTRRLGWP